MPWETAEALAPAAARPAASRPTCRTASSSTSISRTARPTKWPAPWSPRRASSTYGLWVEERADGRGFPYYWLRFGREQRPTCARAPTWRALRDRQDLGDAAEARPHRPRDHATSWRRRSHERAARRPRRFRRLPAAPARQGLVPKELDRRLRGDAAARLPAGPVAIAPPGRTAWCRSNAARRSRAPTCRRTVIAALEHRAGQPRARGRHRLGLHRRRDVAARRPRRHARPLQDAGRAGAAALREARPRQCVGPPGRRLQRTAGRGAVRPHRRLGGLRQPAAAVRRPAVERRHHDRADRPGRGRAGVRQADQGRQPLRARGHREVRLQPIAQGVAAVL